MDRSTIIIAMASFAAGALLIQIIKTLLFMANGLIIAKREIVAIKKGTTSKINVAAEIFLPQPTEDGKDCFCLARFNGIDGESHNTGGVDSLQALSLAISKMKSRFKDLSKEYDFYWPQNNEPMESIDYDAIEKFDNLPKGNTPTAQF